MNILVLIPSLHRGGAERVVSLLTQEWCKAHEVIVAVFDASQTAYAHGGRRLDLSVPANRGGMQKALNFLRRIWRLRDLLNCERPDHVISFMESANFPAVLAALLTGNLTRLTVSVHNDPARFPRAYRWLIPLFYRLPEKVVAVSQGIANALENMGVPLVRLRVIPNPVPRGALGSPAPRPTEAPTKYVLGVGRLHRQKGFDRLIQAFSGIADPDMHLVILGEGNERDTLTELARHLGIAARVRLPGAVVDPTPWYQYAECFVLSSRHEGWPNVLMEAMSNSCPVISFDCRYGPSEIIENGVSGILVDAEDVGSLEQEIKCMLENVELKKLIAAGGIARVSNFYVEIMARHWI